MNRRSFFTALAVLIAAFRFKPAAPSLVEILHGKEVWISVEDLDRMVTTEGAHVRFKTIIDQMHAHQNRAFFVGLDRATAARVHMSARNSG